MSWSLGAASRRRRHALIYGDGDWWHDPATNAFGFRPGGEDPLAWDDVTWDFPGPEEYAELAAGVETGWLAKSGEKAMRAALVTGDPHAVDMAAGQHPQYRNAADVIAGLLSLSTRRTYAAELLQRSVAAGFEPRDDPFIKKYLPNAGMVVPIAPGVAVSLPMMRVAIALTVAELRQAAEDHDAAIEVLFMVDRTTHVTLSLAELLNAVGRFNETVEISETTVNADDVTAMILAYRAIALREIGRIGEARSILDRLIAEGGRSTAISTFAGVVNASMEPTGGESDLPTA